MEYLNIFKNKLANTVVDTVYMAESITKTVLPGNPVTRDYEVNTFDWLIDWLVYLSLNFIYIFFPGDKTYR